MNLLVSNSPIFLSLSQVSISCMLGLSHCECCRDGANFITISLHCAVHDQWTWASQYHGFAPQLLKGNNDTIGSGESHVVAAWNWKTIFTCIYLLFTLHSESPTLSSHSVTSRHALLIITSALLFSTRKPTPKPPFIISPHTLVIAKKVSLDFAVFVRKTQISRKRKRVVIWCPFFKNVDNPMPCCRTIFMPSDGLTGLMSWTITAPLIKGRIGTWVNFCWYVPLRDLILVTLLQIRPHHSQSSRENATPSSDTSPLASYKEVLTPPPPVRPRSRNRERALRKSTQERAQCKVKFLTIIKDVTGCSTC